MASYYFQFLTAFIIFLVGVQEGLSVPAALCNNNQNLNQVFDIDILISRIDQLEAKNEQQMIDNGVLLNRLDQLETSRDRQKVEIDQLNKKNSALEEQLIHQSSQKTSLLKEKTAITRKPSNCLDLIDLGHTLTGFYDVLPAGSSQIASIYCDFALEPTESNFETRIGFVDLKSSPVHFFVTRTATWSTVGTMPFQKEYLNLGGGMDLKSGVFTAPKAGIYAFSFKGLASDTYSTYNGYGSVFLQRNGEDIAEGYSAINGAASGTFATLSIQATLKLNMGDTISIYHNLGTLYSGSSSWTQFTGSLIQEDPVVS